MKKLIKILVMFPLTFSIIEQRAFSVDPVTAGAIAAYSLASLGFDQALDCYNKNDSNACAFLIPISIVEVVITAVALKQMQQVKADAFAYQIDGIPSVELLSTVEKIQQEALDQGHIVSLNDVVDSIMALEK
ncbi:MAG: hypothetical protein AB7I27_04105 [Bacteriovoracaceae bacterium]